MVLPPSHKDSFWEDFTPSLSSHQRKSPMKIVPWLRRSLHQQPLKAGTSQFTGTLIRSLILTAKNVLSEQFSSKLLFPSAPPSDSEKSSPFSTVTTLCSEGKPYVSVACLLGRVTNDPMQLGYVCVRETSYSPGAWGDILTLPLAHPMLTKWQQGQLLCLNNVN